MATFRYIFFPKSGSWVLLKDQLFSDSALAQI